MKKMILKGVNLNHFPEFIPVSESIFQITMVEGVQQILDIPDDARYVVFSSDNIFYTSYDEDPISLPSPNPGRVPTRTEQNPGQRFIGDKRKIRFLTSCSSNIYVSFYG